MNLSLQLKYKTKAIHLNAGFILKEKEYNQEIQQKNIFLKKMEKIHPISLSNIFQQRPTHFTFHMIYFF